ncbi:hypothetical protein PG993_007872 [Apiospora rasikravindrae]|uniref:F-box domain-containing protein n=1 Tax=Apiospora rasikravindrae TaxID=990691 RepID=A0ABR1SYR0_9PEZI
MPHKRYDMPKSLKPLIKSAQLRHKAMKPSNGVFEKACSNIKEKTPKGLTVQAVKSTFKRSCKDNAEKEPLAPSHPSPQLGCILFKLPQEIRDQIYAEVFAATQHHALALLACCSRIRNEIGHSWLNHILLCFKKPAIMLERLLNVPAPLSSVHYVRVYGFEGMMLAKRSTRDPSAYAHVHDFLRALPGLVLKELEVVAAGSGSDVGEYQDVELLLSRSSGWKKLTVHFPHSGLLGDAHCSPAMENEHYEYRYGLQGHVRRPLPRAFREVLLKRDGADSGSTVDIFQGPREEEVSKLSNLRRRILGLQHKEEQFPERHYRKHNKNFDPRYQLRVVAQ